VLTVAVLTAIVNLVVMTVTVQVTGLGRLLFGEGGLTTGVVLEVFFLLLLFAAFFSAVLLAVTSFARSFKEAQAYLIPLVLVALMPGLLSLLPGLQLDGGLVVAPLMNIVLLSRDVLDGTARLGVAVQVVLATVVYAVAAVALAARVFGAEAVLYNEQGSWGDLVRRPSRPRPTASVSAALLCLALMFPAFFVASFTLRELALQSMSANLAAHALVTVFLCGLLPLGSAWLGRVQTASGFRLERAAVGAWGAAVLLGLCLWPLALEVGHLLRASRAGTLTDVQLSEVELQLRLLRTVPMALVLLCQAVLPALFEEFFFRGYLLSALLRAGSPRSAIVGSALFFGAFHLLGRGLVQVESGVNATLLGLVLGWLCWRTGSLVPGMIVHVLHNSLLIGLVYLKPWLIEQGWLRADQDRLPLAWTAGAALVCVVAVVWVVAWSRRQASLAPPDA
jgi:sodium transport system permease protein